MIWCDNMSAISLTRNPIFHQRTKYIEVDIHLIREKVAAGVLEVKYINTVDQVADIFTKGLHPRRLQFLASKLSVAFSVKHLPQFEDGW